MKLCIFFLSILSIEKQTALESSCDKFSGGYMILPLIGRKSGTRPFSQSKNVENPEVITRQNYFLLQQCIKTIRDPDNHTKLAQNFQQ